MLPGCSRSPAPPPDRPPPAVRVAAGAVVKNGCSGATRRGRFAAAAATGFEAVDALPSRVHWPLAGLASRTARAGRADDLRRLSTASAPLAAGRPSVGAASAANKATASAAARVALTRDERRAPKIGASRGASVVAPVGPPTPTSTTPPPLPPSPPPLPSASELPPEPPAPRGAGDGTAASAWEGGARYQRSTTSPAGRVAARRLARRAAWRSCEVDGVNTTPGMRWNAQPGGGGAAGVPDCCSAAAAAGWGALPGNVSADARTPTIATSALSAGAIGEDALLTSPGARAVASHAAAGRAPALTGSGGPALISTPASDTVGAAVPTSCTASAASADATGNKAGTNGASPAITAADAAMAAPAAAASLTAMAAPMAAVPSSAATEADASASAAACAAWGATTADFAMGDDPRFITSTAMGSGTEHTATEETGAADSGTGGDTSTAGASCSVDGAATIPTAPVSLASGGGAPTVTDDGNGGGGASLGAVRTLSAPGPSVAAGSPRGVRRPCLAADPPAPPGDAAK